MKKGGEHRGQDQAVERGKQRERKLRAFEIRNVENNGDADFNTCNLTEVKLQCYSRECPKNETVRRD
jgi:hypothetical protein